MPLGESQFCWDLLRRTGLDANLRRGSGPRFDIQEPMALRPFVKLLRTLTVDQCFWMPLLPSMPKEGTVLVIDDSCGNLSRGLALHFQRVISMQPNAVAAALLADSLRRSEVDNIVVVQADLSKPLPIAVGTINLCVSLRLGHLLARHYGADYLNIYRHVLTSMGEALTVNGVMLIADDNCQNYFNMAKQVLGRKITGYQGVPWLETREMLRSFGMQIQEYVGKFDYNEGLLPLPDLVLREHAALAEPLKKNLTGRIKQYLLNRRLSTRYWPAFLFCASKQGVLNSVQEMVQAADLATLLHWQTSKVEVRRLIAGNADVTVVMVGPVGNTDIEVVLRLPRSKAGFVSAGRNADVITALQKGSFAALTPKLLASGEYLGQRYYIEEKKAGRELQEFSELADQMVREACLVLARGQAKTAVRRVLTKNDYDILIGGCIGNLRPYCNKAEQAVLQRVDELLQLFFIGKETPLVRTHGDFKLGNVLFLADQSVGAIIDWDLSETSGLPLSDLFVLMTYRRDPEEQKNYNLIEFYRQKVLPWKMPVFYQKLLPEVAAILDVDERLFLPIRCLSWLMNLRDRLDWTLKSHEGWASEGIGAVLGDIEQILADASSK
ncbi:MAG: aminoglycoside phosphotransferase family protein [Gammaproteobacteria bacterium]|nr:aminoglycoside phosphotransferase family protein [Gammaproteobacteria bacterium]